MDEFFREVSAIKVRALPLACQVPVCISLHSCHAFESRLVVV